MNNNLLEVCGSPQRAAVILNASRQVAANGEPITPATVGALLPEDRYPNIGEVGDDECVAVAEILEAEAANTASLQIELPATDEAQPPADDVAAAEPVAPIDRDAALESLRLAHIALANARAAVITAQNKRTGARARLADAISAWQSGLPKISREQAAREVIATHQMTRAQRRAPSPSGPSYWDRVKSYGVGGDGNEWARRQHINGGNLRGAFPGSARGKLVKVPSQQ